MLTMPNIGFSLPLKASGGLRMSKETIELKYDGPGLRSHQMDVRDLAPALLGVGNLIRDANFIINNDSAEVRVMVNSDMKPGSFVVGLEVWQEVVGAVLSLLGGDGIKTARDILERLDLLSKIAGVGIVGGLGVLGYYKWRDGRDIVSVQHVTDSSAGGTVNIMIKGDGNTVNIDRSVYELTQNPRIARAAKAVLAPLKTDEIDTVQTLFNGSAQLSVNKADAKQIEASCDAVIDDENILSKSIIEAHLTPYDITFNTDAARWKFEYGGTIITADITGTTIARDAVARRGVSMDDLYHVQLEITERQTPSGKTAVDYKIVRLIERKRGNFQPDLLAPPEDNSDAT
jgi:hypothetical protein